MLRISTGATACARLTQAFARVNLGASRSYANPSTPPISEEGEKKRKPRKPKFDQSLFPPRRPLSAYARFIVENKEAIAKEDARRMFIKLSEKWGEMSEAEKKRYAATEEEWTGWQKSFAQWKDEVEPAALAEYNRFRKGKGMKLLYRTKRTGYVGSYALYYKEFYAKMVAEGPATIPEIGKAAAVKWRQMTDEEKQPYKDQAAALKEERAKNVATSGEA